MRVAPPVVLVEEQRQQLLVWSRGRRTAARLVRRARIVLLAAEGKQNKQIAEELGSFRESWISGGGVSSNKAWKG
jgi:DNA-binding NarL/FixJ family response regulator